MSEEEYTITDAPYAKGQKIVCCKAYSDVGGWSMKTRAMRLADALKGRYVHRGTGYIMSPTKAKRFEKLYAEGWDGAFITRELIPPKESGLKP